MRSAARDDYSSKICAPRPGSRLGSVLLTAALGACSVYQSDLLDEAAATAGAAGKGAAAGSAGKSNSGGAASGGTSSETAGVGHDSEAGETSGGNSGVAGSTTEPQAGTGNVAGSAGGTGAAGSAGTGGTGPGTSDLVDGFEDRDLVLEQTNGRGGVWYAFNDGSTGTAGPSPLLPSELVDAPVELGTYAMHITATGFTVWGSGLGADFRAGKKPYDASAMTGIRFWARVGTGKNKNHRVQLVDPMTDKVGGKCNPAANAPDLEKCDDHFGKNFVFTDSWVQYSVKFTDLSQIGFGLPATALDTTSLYGIQVTAKPKLEVDLWLDQIEFF